MWTWSALCTLSGGSSPPHRGHEVGYRDGPAGPQREGGEEHALPGPRQCGASTIGAQDPHRAEQSNPATPLHGHIVARRSAFRGRTGKETLRIP
ncbi:hypothetical protein GCM10025789_17860 [Tessaracoccus lubricantis]|uniref:Secreted protein n=1 Tax=Tessaracoccus lubricantis TaxID=545543 RepID=A0ABP9FFC9_9ACTN